MAGVGVKCRQLYLNNDKIIKIKKNESKVRPLSTKTISNNILLL